MIASIEAPLTFLQIPVKIFLFDAVKFAQVAFGLVPEILDAVDMIISVRKQFRVIDPVMLEVRDIQGVVGIIGVGINNTVGSNLLLNDGQ